MNSGEEKISELAERFLQTMSELGISGYRLKQDGVINSEPTLTKIKRGIQEPSKKTIDLFCEKYGVCKAWIYAGEGPHIIKKSTAVESSMGDLNRSINIGLKEIGKEIGVDGLQFYSARHSMASIAANEAGIDRWTVNLMLNHTDQSMRVTELYIKRDFSPVNEANYKLMEYVFGKVEGGE